MAGSLGASAARINNENAEKEMKSKSFEVMIYIIYNYLIMIHVCDF